MDQDHALQKLQEKLETVNATNKENLSELQRHLNSKASEVASIKQSLEQKVHDPDSEISAKNSEIIKHENEVKSLKFALEKTEKAAVKAKLAEAYSFNRSIHVRIRELKSDIKYWKFTDEGNEWYRMQRLGD